MNLRDLIYSQQSQPVPVSQVTVQLDEDQPTTTQEELNKRPFSQVSNNFSDEESHSAAEDGTDKETEAQNKKRLRTGTTNSLRKVNVYGDRPSVKQQILIERDRKHGARMPTFAPGLLSAARFPQRNTSILTFQRDIVRQLWYRCYFAKDFEGAAMALSVLTEIDPLTPADVSASAQLLRYSDTAAGSAKKLVQGLLKPLNRDTDRRHAAIAMSTELLLSQNEVKAARKLLQENIIEFTAQGKQLLVAYDTLVIIASAVILAQDLCNLSPVAFQSPSIEDITVNPLEFSKCVRIVNMARSTASFANPKLKGKRQECNQLFRDLKAAFNKSVVGVTAVHDRMDMEALYLAFLHGSGHESKALRYLANLKRLIPSADETAASAATSGGPANGVLYMYHQLAAAYITRYRFVPPEPGVIELRGESSQPGASSEPTFTTNMSATSTGNATYTRIVGSILKKRDYQAHVVPSALHLYEATLLHEIGTITPEVYLTQLCDMIEMSANPMQPDPYNSQSNVLFTPLQFILWSKLASRLGPVEPKIARNAPIDSSSEICRYSPAAAAKLPGRAVLKANEGYQHINPLAKPSAAVGISSADAAQVTATAAPAPAASGQPSGSAALAVDELAQRASTTSVTSTVLAGREWWASSLLSAAQLDLFTTAASLDLPAALTSVERLVGPAASTDVSCAPTSAASAGASSTSAQSQGTSEVSRGAPLLDSYDHWAAAEKAFTTQLGELFATRHRHMSEDLSAEDSDASDKSKDKKSNNKDTGGADDAAEDVAQDSNTSHDDAEYHSNKSECEVANNTEANAAGSSSQPAKTAAAYIYHKDVLNFAAGGVHEEVNASGRQSEVLQRLAPHNISLAKEHFTVRRIKTVPSTGSAKPNSLAARLARPSIQYILGDRVLEMLTYQAVVRAHLHTQDNMFTIRVVQIVVSHALRSSAATTGAASAAVGAATSTHSEAEIDTRAGAYCVRYLHEYHVDVVRALKIGAFLAAQGVNPATPPPTYYDLHAELTTLGAGKAGGYCPV